jgi:beta-xylosidase
MAATGGKNDAQGTGRQFRLMLSGMGGSTKVVVRQVNGQVGTAIPKWHEMGSPQYPNESQIAELKSAAEPEPHIRTLGKNGEFAIELPADGIALLEIARGR